MFRPLFKEFKKGRYVISHVDKYQLCGYQYGFFDNESVWYVPHNAGSKFFLLEVIVGGEIVKDYDLVIIDDDAIKITFSQPTNGYINLLIYTQNETCVPPFAITVTPSNTPTPTPTPSNTPTFTPTASITPTFTPTVTMTPTINTPTPTPTMTQTPTMTVTPTNTATTTHTPAVSPSSTATQTPTPTRTQTNTPTPSMTPTIGTLDLPFEFAVARYYWVAADGTDFATRSYISDPARNIIVGQGRNANDSIYLFWGGDDSGSPSGGSEAVLIDFVQMEAAFPSETDLKVLLGGYWHGSKLDGNVFLEVETYTGGAMQHVGNDYINVGGSLVQHLTLEVNAPTFNSGDIDGDSLGLLTYDTVSNTASLTTFIPAVTVTPTPTQTATPTQTPSNTITQTPTQTSTSTPTPTQTATSTSTPTRTPTQTATQTATNTATPTQTATNTPTNTATPSNTPSNTVTPTGTRTPTPTQTATPSNTPTQTATPSQTATNTPTNTATPSQTPTQTSTPSNTPTNTPTNTATPSQTPTNTVTPTQTATNTPTNTATPSNTPTNTPTSTQTGTPTQTPQTTPSNTPTQTATPSQTPTNTITPTQTPTNTPTNTATPSNTPTNTATQTATPSQTPTNTITPTNTATQTSTPSNTPTNTPTNTATPSNTPTNTVTPTRTPSQTPTNTATPSNTPSQTATPSNTPTNTATPSRTPSNTPTSSITPSNTPSQTNTPTNTPTNTVTNTVTPSNTATQTRTPSNTPTNSPTPSNTPSNTRTPSNTPTNTPSPSNTPSNTSTPSATPSNTPTNSATPSNTPTISVTPSNTPSHTPTPSNTPSTGGADANYKNVVSLLHFNGTNGGTNFDDITTKTWTVGAGAPVLSNTQAKFGATSLRLDGSSYISTLNNGEFYLLTGDFTFEIWVYVTGAQSGMGGWILSKDDTATSFRDIELVIGGPTSGANGQLYFSMHSNFASTQRVVDPDQFLTNQWVHVAVTKSAGTLRLFVNGTLKNSISIATGQNATTNNLQMGANVNSSTGASGFFTGWLDDFRFTNGIARYTSNFVPQSTQFADFNIGFRSTVVATYPFLYLPMQDAAGSTSALDYSPYLNSAPLSNSAGAGNPVSLIPTESSDLSFVSTHATPVTIDVPLPGGATYNGSATIMIIYKMSDGTPTIGIPYRPGGGGSFVYFNTQFRFGSGSVVIGTTNPNPLDAQTHILILRFNTSTLTYDYIIDNTYVLSGSSASVSPSNIQSPLGIMYNGGFATQYCEGTYSHFALWERALSNSEIQAIYDAAFGNSVTPTPTVSVTASNTPTPSNTPTQTRTPSNTPSPTKTSTPNPTPSATPTNTASKTRTPTNTPTATMTNTRTPTNTPSPTQTAPRTATPTPTPTNTASPSITASQTPSVTRTQTQTPSVTSTNTMTPTQSASTTPPPGTTPTPTPSPTRTPAHQPAIALEDGTGLIDMEDGTSLILKE